MHYHGHRDRLRSRLKDAPESLEEYEVLELLLGYPIIRRDTKPIAKELLARFGSLKGMLDAPAEEYMDIPGIGKGVVDFFHVLRELQSRYAETELRSRETLCSPESVAVMARQRLGRLRHEELWLAFVDNRNRLISWEKGAKGSLDRVAIHPRDIMEKALMRKASGFVVVHNHPGGNADPSAQDRAFTAQLERAAQALFIRFLDHLVISDTEAYSILTNRYV
jgi:DNA repair protein RadC